MDAQLIALITGLASALLAFAKWAMGQWTTVRREERGENDRMIAALLAQATSNVQLSGRIDALGAKLDTLATRLDSGFESISKVDNIVHAPAPSAVPVAVRREVRERIATHPSGHLVREPRRGTHHDSED